MKLFSVFAKIILILLLTVNLLYSGEWTQQTSPVTTDLFGAWAVNTNICWMCGPEGVVIRTTNGGSTWALANSGLSSSIGFYTICAQSSEICWTGAEDGTLWKTTNGGALWLNIPLNPTNPFIDAIHFFDNNLGFILADPSGGIWRYYITTNGGITWSLGTNAPAASGNEACYNNSYCALDTAHIWFGTNNTQIYKGSFKGLFTAVSTAGAVNTFGIAFNNPLTGTAAMANSVFSVVPNIHSTDGGTSWSSGTYIPAGVQYGIKGVPGTDRIWMSGAGLFSGHVFMSTDNGNWFETQYTFVPGNAGGCISMVDVNCGWTATISTETGINGGKIYKYTDNVGVINKSELPYSFKLEQNYPNPFNPSTKIKFSVANSHIEEGKEGALVKIVIYDNLGKEIETLLNENLSSGSYEIEWEAANFPSGVYFYRLSADDFSETRKMILVK